MRLNVREILRISAIKQVYMIVFNYNVKMEGFDGTSEKG